MAGRNRKILNTSKTEVLKENVEEKVVVRPKLPGKKQIPKEVVFAPESIFDDENDDDVENLGQEKEQEEYHEEEGAEAPEEYEEENEEEDDDDGEEAENDEEIDSEDEDDSLFSLTSFKRQARLEEGVYPAWIGKVTAKKVQGEYGDWIKVTIPFEIINENNDSINVNFVASSNLNPAGRLYPIIKGILGQKPPEGFDARKIKGTKVNVKISHYIDSDGNVWEQVDSAKKIK